MFPRELCDDLLLNAKTGEHGGWSIVPPSDPTPSPKSDVSWGGWYESPMKSAKDEVEESVALLVMGLIGLDKTGLLIVL
eukprot:CAMPEP_0118672494 /NCGR_PEP_ID=MMETSP0785-20121206/22570_1 /TAXON_ID=91992 /ORGANISM="Bolidomonas pacifica, Strain CCMP 1866" /LENGTH=78 /DNA_ID=CAMNT_0006567459 /DNA_START=372 /DNA_END=608 /DNA_ORIENTATION=-